MKKIIFTLISFLLILTLSSCKITNKYQTYENGYNITVGEELKPYLLFPDQIPVLHFDMNNVNVSTTSTNYKLVLVNNDFDLVSDAWAKHLSKYAKNYVITQNEPQTREDKSAKFGDTNKKLDELDEFGNKQEYSREIMMMAWTDDGTRYSYQFRTFVSGGKRYYAFCYSTSLTMVLEQSLMVVEEDGNNKLLLIPLPYDTKYAVSGTNTNIDSLVKKDTYLDESYYTFYYPNSLQSKTLEEKMNLVATWYQTFCNGRMENGDFLIDYAGATFKVTFNLKKENKDAFRLTYIKK